MHLIKIKDCNNVVRYISAEFISSISYTNQATLIVMNNKDIYKVMGDMAQNISKLVTQATEGSILRLE